MNIGHFKLRGSQNLRVGVKSVEKSRNNFKQKFYFWGLGVGGQSFSLTFRARDRSRHEGSVDVTPDL